MALVDKRRNCMPVDGLASRMNGYRDAEPLKPR